MQSLVVEHHDSEVYEELGRATEKACGKPGWPVAATFAALVTMDPETRKIVFSTRSWPDDPDKLRELRACLRQWLEAADRNDEEQA